MGFFLNAGLGGLLLYGLKKCREDIKEEERRKSIECKFGLELSEERFAAIAIGAAKSIKRLWVEVNGPIIYGTVESITGASEWNFTLDFNDYGKITGKYWIDTENEDSGIPKRLASKIKDRLPI